jgi:hypothetical protein
MKQLPDTIKRMKKVIIALGLFFLLSTYYLLHATVSYAVCPVCTIAVGAGLGLSRWLGIDDTVSGLWVGGLILSSSLWLIDWINKKKPNILNTKYNIPIILLMYAIVFIPLWLGKTIGHPYNRILGIDKLVFGTIVGSLVFLGAVWLDKKVRTVKGHQLFSYQRVVFPVVSLVIASVLMYLLTK